MSPRSWSRFSLVALLCGSASFLAGCSAGLDAPPNAPTAGQSGIVLPSSFGNFERISISDNNPEKGATKASYTGTAGLGSSIKLFLNTEVVIVPARGRTPEGVLAQEKASLVKKRPAAVQERSGASGQGVYAYHTYDREGWNDRAGHEIHVRRHGDYLVVTEFAFLATRRADWEPSMKQFLDRVQ